MQCVDQCVPSTCNPKSFYATKIYWY